MTPRKIPPLRDVRRARNLKLRPTAVRAGIDPAHLSRIERGEKLPSLDTLYRIAVVLGLSELANMLALYLPDHDAEAGAQ